MKKLLISLIVFSNFAFAQVSPQSVAAECTKQMAAGICMAIPDHSSVAPGQQMLIAGIGRVNYSAYIDYMDKYNPAIPSDPAMCKLALEYMTTEPGSDHDKVARALWLPLPEPEKSFVDVAATASASLGAASAAFLTAFLVLRRRKNTLILKTNERVSP